MNIHETGEVRVWACEQVNMPVKFWRALEGRFLMLLIAFGTKSMRRLSMCHHWLIGKAPNSGYLTQFIALLLSFPCFKASHFFFKIVYALQQRRLRNLCPEDFFLQFYDCAIPNGGVVNILQTLRHIKHGLEGAEISGYLGNHAKRVQDGILPT